MSKNFDIPVTNNSYSGSDRAKKAMAKATQSGMHKPMVGEGPASVASQSDMGIRSGDQNLLQSSQPKVLNGNTKPATGATPPNRVNPEGRPGMGAKKTNAFGKGGR